MRAAEDVDGLKAEARAGGMRLGSDLKAAEAAIVDGLKPELDRRLMRLDLRPE